MGGDFFYRFRFELRTAQKAAGRWKAAGWWAWPRCSCSWPCSPGWSRTGASSSDFFTFRPGKGGQRAWLDAHNVSGVLVLLFYLMITFSGLMIFHSMYLPSGIATAYAGADGKVDSNTYFADLQATSPSAGPGASQAPRSSPAADPCGHHPDCRTKALGRRPHRLHPGAARCPRQTGGGSHRHEGDRLQYRPPCLLFDATHCTTCG